MRLKNKTNESIPSVNLIPMLNVMLGILAFFVMITMTLSASEGISLQLPASPDALPPPEAEEPPEETPPPLVVTLNRSDQVLVDETLTTRADADRQVQSYLEESEEGVVYVTADEQMPYEEVIQFLIEMKRLGGDRISLALDEN